MSKASSSFLIYFQLVQHFNSLHSYFYTQSYAISAKRFQFMHNSVSVVSFNASDCRVKLLNTIGQESSQLSSFKMQAQYKQ